MSSDAAAIAAKRVRDDLAYARFSWFHVKVKKGHLRFRWRQEKGRKCKGTILPLINKCLEEASAGGLSHSETASAGFRRIKGLDCNTGSICTFCDGLEPVKGV